MSRIPYHNYIASPTCFAWQRSHPEMNGDSFQCVGSDHFSLLPTARYDWTFAIYSAMAILTSKPAAFLLLMAEKPCLVHSFFCLAALLDQRVAPGFVYLEMCSFNNVVVPGSCAGFFFHGHRCPVPFGVTSWCIKILLSL